MLCFKVWGVLIGGLNIFQTAHCLCLCPGVYLTAAPHHNFSKVMGGKVSVLCAFTFGASRGIKKRKKKKSLTLTLSLGLTLIAVQPSCLYFHEPVDKANENSRDYLK